MRTFHSLFITVLLVARFISPTFGQLDYTSYAFSTLAGSANQLGSADGAAAAARFFQPNGVAIDATGNLFVADQGNNEIRRITPSGVVTTFAGRGQFQFLTGIAVDANGNVYVSDAFNNVIYKISSAGAASVLAGTIGVPGSADGAGTAAQFNEPDGLAMDSNGNVFVADLGNNTIRKITSAGVVTTIAGMTGVKGYADGSGTAALFSRPAGIAVDGSGIVYVGDTGNNAIRKISPSGVVSTLAGSGSITGGATDGFGEAAQFASPEGLAVDSSGNVFVADNQNSLIRKVSTDGSVTTIAGYLSQNADVDGTGNGASFRTPSFVTVDATGILYVSDTSADTIRKGVAAFPPTVKISASVPSTPIVNGSASFSVVAIADGAATYQWYLNGSPIIGAHNPAETIYPSAANQGDYSLSVTNAFGSASTDAGTLVVATDAWLINLSARAYVETGANQLIAGFVTTGNIGKSLLIRGDGPALSGFGVSGSLPDPQLTLVSGSTTIATANSWNPVLDATFANVGAFVLTPGSHDAALLESLAPGAYTAQIVSQSANDGVALAEIYDADNSAPADRLINISARAFVGNGSNVLIGGFVIGGNTPLTVIIRGDGPSLSAFGLSNSISNTSLTLTSSATGGVIATNSGWSKPLSIGANPTGAYIPQPLTAALSAKVGAFALGANSGDSAIVATLPPGAYTAQLSGTNNSTGVGLLEIYELR